MSQLSDSSLPSGYSHMSLMTVDVPVVHRIADLKKFTSRIGMLVDVLDTSFYWYFGCILEVDLSRGLKVHYDGFDDKWDEWIRAEEMCRITERHSHAHGGKESVGVHVFEATSYAQTTRGSNNVRRVLQMIEGANANEGGLDLSQATRMMRTEIIIETNLFRKTSMFGFWQFIYGGVVVDVKDMQS